MADFLTRLIERSRGVAPSGQRVEPLIAPLYAAGPMTAQIAEEDSIIESDLQYQVLTPRTGEASQWHAQKPSPQDPESNGHLTPEITPVRTLTDESQSAESRQTVSIHPLPPPTPNATLPQALLVNARPVLTANDADQSRRANIQPLMIRPHVSRTDEASSRANEAANEASGETAAPVIRVTIGRIDVRAVSAPAPPARRQAPSAPKLSLDEYLRSRNGRKG
jgi:hypothetical protein